MALFDRTDHHMPLTDRSKCPKYRHLARKPSPNNYFIPTRIPRIPGEFMVEVKLVARPQLFVSALRLDIVDSADKREPVGERYMLLTLCRARSVLASVASWWGRGPRRSPRRGGGREVGNMIKTIEGNGSICPWGEGSNRGQPRKKGENRERSQILRTSLHHAMPAFQ